jgi:hypothetical protein
MQQDALQYSGNMYTMITGNRSLKVAVQGLDFKAHPLYIHARIPVYKNDIIPLPEIRF